MEKVHLKLGFSSKFTVDCHGDGRRRSGGLCLLWRSSVDIRISSFSLNHIDAVISEGLPHRNWRLTGVYGYPNDSDKHKTWQRLTTLFHSCSLPWMCLGDFNEILYNTENKGYPFTWSNGRCEEDNVQERLDRVFAIESWLLLFPYVAVEHLQCYTSDHCAISIYFDDICFPKPRGRKKIF
ncbi:Exo_endo_phos domain-containing protein [Senna tora]|uniref:Exo_endo_phos domain-containing protein n=1 Tax=Senna tora TaxID=362788 RepID=A0A834WYZ4_9FABA|nr:Exo_endo_phos domain-containing protein [Senna tora]